MLFHDKVLEKLDGGRKETACFMMASISSLHSAVTTLSKHNAASSLVQLTDSEEIDLVATVRTMLNKHKDLLGEVITPKQRRMVEAFAQQPGSYFDEAPKLIQQRQKYNPEYAPQSGQIFGVLNQMKETFETNLAKSQAEEGTNQQSYEDMKAAKESEIKAGTDQSNKKSALLAESDEKHAQSKEDLEQTEATLAADRKYLANLKAHCANIDAEYEERVKTRNMETEANSKALTLLTSDEASDLFSKSLGFVQLSSRNRDARRNEVAKKLLAAGRAAHDPRLSTLAARMRLDAFGKVKESLQGMMDSLIQEKEDEIKHKDYCVDSLNVNARTTETKKEKKADAEAKVADHMNAMENLEKAIALDKEEIANLRVQLKKLSEDREKANNEFQVTVADQRATQKLLTAALDVLKGFYERPALVQSKAHAGTKQPAGPPPPPGFKKAADNAASGGVMNMIQTIINDAKAMETEALQAEAQAQQAYEDAVADTNAAVKAKQEDIVSKTEFHAREEASKVEQEATRDERIADIDQLMKENLDLHFSCDYMIKNFEIRMTARDEEVEALKQGLATFSGATFSSLLETA